jgi:hypothetical protein
MTINELTIQEVKSIQEFANSESSEFALFMGKLLFKQKVKEQLSVLGYRSDSLSVFGYDSIFSFKRTPQNVGEFVADFIQTRKELAANGQEVFSFQFDVHQHIVVNIKTYQKIKIMGILSGKKKARDMQPFLPDEVQYMLVFSSPLKEEADEFIRSIQTVIDIK